MTFSDQLYLLRAFLGFDQSQVAQSLAISRNYVSMMESEEAPRTPSKTVRLLFDQLWDAKLPAGLTPEIVQQMRAAQRRPDKRLERIFATVKGAEKTPTESAFQEVRSDSIGAEDGAFGIGRPCLKRAREAAGLSQAELAKTVGYSLRVYQNIEEGRSNLSRKMAERLAGVLKIPVDDLLGGGDHVAENSVPYGTMGETPALKLPPGMKAKYVPLLAMCECGPSMAFDDGGYEYAGFVAFNIDDPLAFAVKLSGDSMTPQYWPGDVAVITPSKPLRNGAVVIARISEDQDKQHGGEVMCKLYQASGDSVTLSSYNPAFPPMTFSRRSFNWIYPVAQVTKVLP